MAWVEAECEPMRQHGDLAVDLPPCLFPYILPHHPDWRPRYEQFNQPGDYHNGGVWPFVCGFYVAACVAAGRIGLATHKLLALTKLVKPWHKNETEWGFNEWIKAQTGQPSGQDWQTWSAAMYSTLLRVCSSSAPRSLTRSAPVALFAAGPAMMVTLVKWRDR